jgi:hypothetical protein
LLLRIFRALQKEYPAEYNAKLNQEVEALYQLSPQEGEHQAAPLLREFIGQCTLLLLMENLDDVFNGLGDIGQKQLRAYIQNYSFLTILATAQSLFDGIIRKDDPFYNFFYDHHLEELTLDETVDLLSHIAELEGDRELENFMKTVTLRDHRIRTIHHLCGGNRSKPIEQRKLLQEVLHISNIKYYYLILIGLLQIIVITSMIYICTRYEYELIEFISERLFVC